MHGDEKLISHILLDARCVFRLQAKPPKLVNNHSRTSGIRTGKAAENCAHERLVVGSQSAGAQDDVDGVKFGHIARVQAVRLLEQAQDSVGRAGPPELVVFLHGNLVHEEPIGCGQHAWRLSRHALEGSSGVPLRTVCSGLEDDRVQELPHGFETQAMYPVFGSKKLQHQRNPDRLHVEEIFFLGTVTGIRVVLHVRLGRVAIGVLRVVVGRQSRGKQLRVESSDHELVLSVLKLQGGVPVRVRGYFWECAGIRVQHELLEEQHVSHDPQLRTEMDHAIAIITQSRRSTVDRPRCAALPSPCSHANTWGGVVVVSLEGSASKYSRISLRSLRCSGSYVGRAADCRANASPHVETVPCKAAVTGET
eukprot:scaffold1285_cov243-Pinguiococcus_pyrenoidosus.AAC.2